MIAVSTTCVRVALIAVFAILGILLLASSTYSQPGFNAQGFAGQPGFGGFTGNGGLQGFGGGLQGFGGGMAGRPGMGITGMAGLPPMGFTGIAGQPGMPGFAGQPGFGVNGAAGITGMGMMPQAGFAGIAGQPGFGINGAAGISGLQSPQPSFPRMPDPFVNMPKIWYCMECGTICGTGNFPRGPCPRCMRNSRMETIRKSMPLPVDPPRKETEGSNKTIDNKAEGSNKTTAIVIGIVLGAAFLFGVIAAIILSSGSHQNRRRRELVRENEGRQRRPRRFL